MSGKRKRGARRAASRVEPAAAAKESRVQRAPGPARAASRARHALFLAITLAIPILLFVVVEVAFRLADRSGGLPVFVEAPFAGPGHLVANRAVGRRWFSGVESPPGPMPEPFALEKPARGFRIFVLGESSTAGFPYPRNATFSRLLRDVLRDVLPGDSVEVVNLGIAATNSYAMLDMAEEVARNRPDAVLIYAGHNEYYGALGVASREGPLGAPAFTRAYLRLLRLRSVLALRNAVASVRRGADGKPGELEAASLMELLAREKQIPLDSETYRSGVAQFESNLERIVRTFRSRDIPVFIGSVASNIRDQPPFAAEANGSARGSAHVFAAAATALARGDTAAARDSFARARDLDVVRFRAPSEFNSVIRRVTARTGARYVPVAESFASAAPAGIPGRPMFLEHVHPSRSGQALIARTFYEDLARSGSLPSSFSPARLRSWSEYERETWLSPLDERVALHTVRTLTARWPFVPVSRQTDYRGTYTPTDLLDSLAFEVSRGSVWETAKLRLGADYERRGLYDSAAFEYSGLLRDAPSFREPRQLLGRVFASAARQAAGEKDLPRAVSLLNRSLAVDPNRPEVLFQLLAVHGLRRDLVNARATALALARIAPQYPGLEEWLGALGLAGSRP